MIKFSLIMPAYNAEKYICESIDSVINQKYKNWELIVVDDGSSDKTGKIIDQYQEDDKRIVAIHQKNSGTAAAARNTALNYVTGDYVQMIDADDLLKEDLLSVFEQKLSNSDFDIVIPNCICFENDNLENVFWEKNAPENDYDSVLSGEKAFELSLDWIIHGFFLVKKDIIFAVRYDPQLINGDEFTTRKLLYRAKKIGFVESYYYYRRNMESTTKNTKNMYRMYECLLTDMNIYRFALDNQMSNGVVRKCENKLTRAFFMYCKKIVTYEERSDETDKAEEILAKVCSYLSYDIVKSSSLKYRLVYLISGGIYSNIRTLMKVVVRFGF